MKAASGTKKAIVVGGGPAGLKAAEMLSERGIDVDVYDAMPSVGRKFLLAGIGGMNITHSEDLDAFLARYRSPSSGDASSIRRCVEQFTPGELRAWLDVLGIETFVGSSGRVFPREMKAAPLLRAWLHRLREHGVRFHPRHRWHGWNAQGEMVFATPHGDVTARADVVVLALGGGSWPRLGSDAAWIPWLQERGVDVRPLLAANAGFECEWSEHFRERFAGEAVKQVVMRFASPRENLERRGEFIVTREGIEGSLVYAFSAALRDELLRTGTAQVFIDLVPDRDETQLAAALAKPRGRKTFAEHLRRQAGIKGVKAGLLREGAEVGELEKPSALAHRLKSLPLRLARVRPLDEAISTAGGVTFEALTAGLMLQAIPGVFCAGEMLDWEAPTGGYLLTACFATGRVAGCAAAEWAIQQR